MFAPSQQRYLEGRFVTIQELRAAVIHYAAQLLFIAVCCALIGGGIQGLRSQTFNMPERVRALEVEGADQSAEITMLRAEQERERESIAELHGMGIAVGSSLAVLQLLSMVFSRKKEREA